MYMYYYSLHKHKTCNGYNSEGVCYNVDNFHR